MTTVLLVVGLMVLGLALIAIEVLVIPGFGVIGVLGMLASLASGYVAITELDPAYAATTITVGVVAAGVMFWLFPRTRAGKAMVLEAAIDCFSPSPGLEELVDREGVCITPLRPSGTVEIDKRPVDVVSDGQYVDAGVKVRVVKVEGARVVVEPQS